MQLAVGASYRKEYTHSIVDTSLLINPATGQCVLGSACGSSLQGGYNVKDVYAELFVPILKDIPFVHALNLTVGDRYSKYNTFGNTNNSKIALEWRPIEDLLVRGTVSEVFRAPTVADLFASAASDAPRLSHDPCNHYTGNPVNPACVGVPTDGSFVNSEVASGLQSTGIVSGSEFAGFPLGPEFGKSFDWGVVYDPHFIEGLSVSADLWRLYLKNTITTVRAQSVVDLCSAGQLAYCPLIHRYAVRSQPGRVPVHQRADRQPRPHRCRRRGLRGELSAAGILVRPFQRWRECDLPARSTTSRRHRAPTRTRLSLRRSLHELRLGAGGRMPRRGRWRVSVPALACAELGQLAARGFRCIVAHALHRTIPDGLAGAFAGRVPGRHLLLRRLLHAARLRDQVRRNGLQRHPVGYNLEAWNTRFDIGVNNLADKQPPFLFANNTLNANTDPSDFDLLGRFYFGRVTVKF